MVCWAERAKGWEEDVRIRGKEGGKMETTELAAPPASQLTRLKSEGSPTCTQSLTSLAKFDTWPQTYSNLGVHSHPPLPGATQEPASPSSPGPLPPHPTDGVLKVSHRWAHRVSDPAVLRGRPGLHPGDPPATSGTPEPPSQFHGPSSF